MMSSAVLDQTYEMMDGIPMVNIHVLCSMRIVFDVQHFFTRGSEMVPQQPSKAGVKWWNIPPRVGDIRWERCVLGSLAKVMQPICFIR